MFGTINARNGSAVLAVIIVVLAAAAGAAILGVDPGHARRGALILVFALGGGGVALALRLRVLSAAAEGIASQAAQAVAAAAKGDLNVRIVNIERRHSMAPLLSGINRILDLSEAFAKESNAAIRYANERKYFRTIVTKGLRGDFVAFADTINRSLGEMDKNEKAFVAFAQEKVRPVAQIVGQASTALRNNAETLSTVSSETSQQAVTVAAAAEQASVNVQAAASAVEEFSASIREITQQVNRAASVAKDASDKVVKTDGVVQSLGRAAQRIGDVVGLIHDIAGQTNLLALNAAIEAARAGEAGKGFAVVASEVKMLANQTAKATEEVTQQIGQIQEVSRDAAQAIKQIGATVAQIEEASSAVAGAVEEQNAVTREIARNVSEAATQTMSVSQAMGLVRRTADGTLGAAAEVTDSSLTLSRDSNDLLANIDRFLGRLGVAAGA
jgi:methyl-accepting chemotaxis protein